MALDQVDERDVAKFFGEATAKVFESGSEGPPAGVAAMAAASAAAKNGQPGKPKVLSSRETAERARAERLARSKERQLWLPQPVVPLKALHWDTIGDNEVDGTWWGDVAKTVSKTVQVSKRQFPNAAHGDEESRTAVQSAVAEATLNPFMKRKWQAVVEASFAKVQTTSAASSSRGAHVSGRNAGGAAHDQAGGKSKDAKKIGLVFETQVRSLFHGRANLPLLFAYRVATVSFA